MISDFDPGLLPDGVDAALTFAAGTPNDALGMLKLDAIPTTGNGQANVGRYWLGKGRDIKAQGRPANSEGLDGTQLPGTNELIGSEAAFTGIHALRRVDLFTILAIPDATRTNPANPNQLATGLNPNAIFTDTDNRNVRTNGRYSDHLLGRYE